MDGFTGDLYLYLDKPNEVERYAQAFDSIEAAALNESKSRTLIREQGRFLWRKSSYSNGQANCVETAAVGQGGRFVAVRDSKAPVGCQKSAYAVGCSDDQRQP
jgi:hypothetical protein